jgi:hypothetical protein
VIEPEKPSTLTEVLDDKTRELYRQLEVLKQALLSLSFADTGNGIGRLT